MTALAKDLNHKNPIEQSTIDARLQKLSDKVLPSSPYILTIPTNYRVGSHQINDWRRGSPFGAHEEQLSYLSFMARTFDEDNIMHAIGDWDDGNGAIKEKTSHVRSGTNSPLPGQAPKKKISLADYKNKAAGQIGAKTVPQANGQAKAPDKGSMPTAPALETSKPEEGENHQSHKRSIDAISEVNENKSLDHGRVLPPAKKARTSPDPPRVAPKEPEIKKPNLHGLPPLLSPTLPSYIEEELDKAHLNARGSPEKLGHEKTSPAVSKSSDKKGPAAVTSPRVSSIGLKNSKGVTASTPPKSTPSAVKSSLTSQSLKASNSLQQALNQNIKSFQSTSPEESTTNVNGATAGKPLLPGLSKIGKERAVSSVVSQGKSDQKHLPLVLKIPKSSRKAWGRIIKMTPRPKKPEPTKPPHINVKDTSSGRPGEKAQVNGVKSNESRRQQEQRPSNTHSTTKSVIGRNMNQGQNEQDAIKAGDKRRRPEEEQDTLVPPSSKRQKAPGAGESTPKPSTPVRPAIKSPVLSHHGSAQKSHLATPKRDLKSATMRRIGSTEGDVKTPLGGTRSNTPNAHGSTERVSRHDRSGSNTSANSNLLPGKNEDIAFWYAEQQKYLDLGRKLKHDADPFLNSKSDYTIIDEDLKQGAAITIETALCFILGFSLGDQASRWTRKPPDVARWQSLLPYLTFVKKVTQHIPPFNGLIHQLEAICRDTIHVYDLERLEHDWPPLSASEDVGDMADIDSVDQAKKEFTKFKNGLVENARLAQQAWVQGVNNLSLQDLQQSYPKTWSKRAQTAVVAKGEEKLVPKAYGDGGYHLPLRETNSGVQAVRMGWSLLGEWSAKQGVKWEGKIGL